MATATELKKQIKALEANLKNKSKYKPNIVQKLEEKLKTAKAELSKLTKSTTKKPSVLQKLKKMVNSKADLKIYKKPIDKSGRKTDLKKDGDVSALPMGKRITQNVGGNRVAGKSGKAKKGNVYYEYRANRVDVRQPSVKVKRPNKLEEGGMMAKGGKTLNDILYENKKPETINYARLKTDIQEGKGQLAGKVESALVDIYNTAFEVLDMNEKDVILNPNKQKEFAQFMKENDADDIMILLSSNPKYDTFLDGLFNMLDGEGLQLLNNYFMLRGYYGYSEMKWAERSYEIKKTQFLNPSIITPEYNFEDYEMMEKGGELVPYIVWTSKDGDKREFFGEFKSQRSAKIKADKLWETGEFNAIGFKPKSSYEKEGLYEEGGMMAQGGRLNVVKKYNTISDYLKDAKRGDLVLIGRDENDLEWIGDSHLNRFVKIDEEGEGIFQIFGRKGLVSFPSNKNVIVVDKKYEEGGIMADGGTTQKYFLSFNYNPSNLKNEEAERIVSKYTKDWKHDNDFDEVSFFVMGLTMDKAKELESELMMEDAYNIEITKSRYADGGMMADDEQVNLDEKVEEYMNKLKNGEKIKRYFYVRGKSNPKYFETIIKNNSEKDAFKRYESTSQNSLGTLQNEYMSEDDVKRYLKKTISEIRADKEKNGTMAKGGSVLERLKKAKEMGIKGYGKAKEYTKKQIHDQKKKVALDVIVDTLNDDYFDTKKGRKDIRAVRITEELVEEHYAKGGMTDVRMKYAKKDIETLQKEGFMSIYDTKYGVIHLSYKNGNFTIKNNQYNPSIEDYKTIFEGNKEEAVKFLADAYIVEMMARGGMQGYDDREDERLAMEYGKMANKDFVGSHKAREHSRRDDARFEERNIMEMGGKVQYKSHRLNK